MSASLTETLAEVGLFVNEDLGRDDVSEGHEHLKEILVTKLLGKVVDKQVGSFWTLSETREEEDEEEEEEEEEEAEKRRLGIWTRGDQLWFILR